MRHKRLKLSALFLLGLGLTGLQAQTMHVKAKSGTNTAFMLQNIQKMTFGGGNVTVNKVEGSPEALQMNTIQNISFDTLNPIFKIDASANLSNSGTITGSGDYKWGSTVSLTATPAVGYKFINWTENDTLVTSAATYSFTALGARTLVANFQSTSSASRLKDAGKTLTVYPNPVSHSLHVDLTGIEGMGILSILTLEGKEMQLQNTQGERVATLDLRSLPKGMYLCRYSSSTEIRTVKIIKH